MAAHNFTWSPEAEATLRRMYADGETAQAIAFKVGAPSRSAVLGKVHRLGINRNPSVPAPVAKKSPRVVPHNIVAKMATAPTKLQAAATIKGRGLEARLDRAIVEQRPNGDTGALFLEATALQCRMPMPGWDDLPVGEKRVCGREVEMRGVGVMRTPTSWCPACRALVYAPSGITRMRDRQIEKGLAA